jgi:NitT/TauT family transport system substrate-binding protein
MSFVLRRRAAGRHGRRGIAAAVLAALWLTACGTDSQDGAAPQKAPGGNALEQTQIDVGLSLKVLAFLPAYVARAQGFWEEEGLDVNIIEFKGDADVVQALAGDAVDVNVGALQGALNMIKGGQDVKVVWGGMNVADFSWYMQPQYDGWEDLKGKTFAVTSPGSLTELLLKAIAKENGLDPDKDLQIVKVGTTPNAFAALRAGTIDVAFLSPPTKYQAEEEGFKLLATQAEEIAPDWPKEVVYAKQEIIDGSPNTMRAFLRGMSEAIAFAAGNRDETVQIIVDEFKIDAKYAERAYDELIPGFVASGALPSEDAMSAFWQTAVTAGDVTEPWELERWWDDRFADAG